MSIIYKNNNVILKKTKKKKEYELSVDWEKNMKQFWVNFPFKNFKIIEKKQNKDTEKKKYTIYADSITNLTEWKKKNKENYNDAIKMLYDLGNQMQTLEGFNLAIPFFTTDDIIVVEVIDSKHFLYLNDEKIYSFNIENLIEITNIHSKSKFLSPEIIKKNELPMNIHYKSGLYSLASMIINILLSKDIDEKNKKSVIEQIKGTKLYWALNRMLETNPTDRYYLII